jgi:autotransporter passenger strand-loop-strand repeat protein
MGGTLALLGGAVVIGPTTLSAGATDIAAAGYSLSGVTVSAGIMLDVASGGAASGTTVESGGLLALQAGGLATVTDGTHTAKLAMLGNFAQANFQLGNDGYGDTLITYSATPLHPGG